MTTEGSSKDIERYLQELPESTLERNMILEYLGEKGYRLEDLRQLPEEEAKSIMREACRYASLKLAEMESKLRFRQEIRAPD